MTEIVNFSDWEKIDLRVGEILNVEDIELKDEPLTSSSKSQTKVADKLYKLTVDLGKEIGERTVCAGIKKHYSKEELKGKKIILFVNLAPRKLKGIESQGMILAAVNEDESEIVLLAPEEDVEVGLKIR